MGGVDDCSWKEYFFLFRMIATERVMSEMSERRWGKGQQAGWLEAPNSLVGIHAQMSSFEFWFVHSGAFFCRVLTGAKRLLLLSIGGYSEGQQRMLPWPKTPWWERKIEQQQYPECANLGRFHQPNNTPDFVVVCRWQSLLSESFQLTNHGKMENGSPAFQTMHARTKAYLQSTADYKAIVTTHSFPCNDPLFESSQGPLWSSEPQDSLSHTYWLLHYRSVAEWWVLFLVWRKSQ